MRKALTVSVLVVLLTCSAHAGVLLGDFAPPPPPPPEQQQSSRTEGETDETTAGVLETVGTLLQHMLSIL